MSRTSRELNDFHRRRDVYLNWGSNRVPGELPTGEVAEIEAELIDLLRTHDSTFGADALWALLHGRTADLVAIVGRKVHSQEVEDVIHDVMSSLAKDYQKGKLNLSLKQGAASFAEALRKAAKFAIADYYRRPAVVRESVSDSATSVVGEQKKSLEPSFDDQAGGAELWQWLLEVNKIFDGEERLLLFGELWDSPITPQEQAEILGIKPDLRHTRAKAARKKFHEAFATMCTIRQQRTVKDDAATGCRGLTDELDAGEFKRFAPFTAKTKALVARHIKACSNCEAVYLELAALSYEQMLHRFKGALSLPILLTPKLVEPWIRRQQDAADRDRLAELAATVAPPTRNTAHPDSSPSTDATSAADLVDRTSATAPAALAGAAPSILPATTPLNLGQHIQNAVQKLLLPAKTAAVKINNALHSILPGGPHSARGISTAVALVIGGTMALVGGSDHPAAALPDLAPTTATTPGPTTSPSEPSTTAQPSPSGANVPQATSSSSRPTGPISPPSTDPTSEPTIQPAGKPTVGPTKQPTAGPTSKPTTGPAVPPPVQPPAALPDLTGGMSLLYTSMDWQPGQIAWAIRLSPDSAGHCPTADPCDAYKGITSWYAESDGQAWTSDFTLTIRRSGTKLIVDGYDHTDQHYTGTAAAGHLKFVGQMHETSTNRTAQIVLESCGTNPAARACNRLP